MLDAIFSEYSSFSAQGTGSGRGEDGQAPAGAAVRGLPHHPLGDLTHGV